MHKIFNTEGSCDPQKHYMVSLSDRLSAIKRDYVDPGKYFVINRGRQYGKTTTLVALAEYLRDDYIVVSLDFQELVFDDYSNSASFSKAFSKIFCEAYNELCIDNGRELIAPVSDFFYEKDDPTIREMFNRLSVLCRNSAKPIVLIIDEVDKSSNNQVFLDFLSLLRMHYLKRDRKPTFWSVILAGVYDIKNLKLKIRSDDDHKQNSPWNIAADFMIDMSFIPEMISGMLEEYESDNKTGMDIEAVSKCIYAYSDGYPVLVSKICKIIDEKRSRDWQCLPECESWSEKGISKAVGMILSESMPLFQSMTHQLEDYPEMKELLNLVLFRGQKISYNAASLPIQLAAMFGYIVNDDGSIKVANRIFETYLYNYFISEEEMTNAIYEKSQRDMQQFFVGRKLDMDAVIKKFVEYFIEIYGDNEDSFIEKYGRKFFLSYLKPIINGTGNYYIEAQTRDARRTDVIVDYLGEQFIIEMKIWHGNEYNERGEEQLISYLNYYGKKKGYMISFNFNKNKRSGIKEFVFGEHKIIEAVV